MASCKLLILSLLLLLQLANGQLIYNWIWRNFIAPQLTSGVTSNIASSLGVWWQQNAPFIRSYSGQTYNVSQLLGQAIRCSGRYCVDLSKELRNKADLPDVNAKVTTYPQLMSPNIQSFWSDGLTAARTQPAMSADQPLWARSKRTCPFATGVAVEPKNCWNKSGQRLRPTDEGLGVGASGGG